MNKKVLVIGPSGSGKSYFAKHLKKLGLNVFDADLVDGLSSWFDSKGNKVTFPQNAGKEFLDSHKFMWDKSFLKRFLDSNKTIYLFGLSDNVFEILSQFDKVYYLSVPGDILLERLSSLDRDNPMGNTELQKNEIIKYARRMENKAKKLRIEIIDGTVQPKELFKRFN